MWQIKLLINATDLFHSEVLRSPGTDNGSSLLTGCRALRSYRGWACTGLPASLSLKERKWQTNSLLQQCKLNHVFIYWFSFALWERLVIFPSIPTRTQHLYEHILKVFEVLIRWHRDHVLL